MLNRELFWFFCFVFLTLSSNAQLILNSENYFDSYYVNISLDEEDEGSSLPPKRASSSVIIERNKSKALVIKFSSDVKELSQFTQYFLVKSVVPDFTVDDLNFYKVIATVNKNRSVERDIELTLVYRNEMLLRFSFTLPNEKLYQYVFYNEK